MYRWAIGSVSVICTDKTGTLTRNKTVVASAETAAGVFSVTGGGYAPEGDIHPAGDLGQFARSAALCNDASLHDRDRQSVVEGNPMEGALLAFAAKAGGVSPAARRGAVPFGNRHRYMAVLTDAGDTLVKGAPKRVLRMCRDIDYARWHNRSEAMALRGPRRLPPWPNAGLPGSGCR